MPTTEASARQIDMSRRILFDSLRAVLRVISESAHLAITGCWKSLSVKEEIVHLHLCSQCRAVITVDEGRTCPSNSDHEEGLCEACAQAQPGSDEIVSKFAERDF